MITSILNNYCNNLQILLEQGPGTSYGVALSAIKQAGEQLSQTPEEEFYPLADLKDIENKVTYLNASSEALSIQQIDKIQSLTTAFTKNFKEATLGQFITLHWTEQERWLKQPGALEYLKELIALHDHSKEMNASGDRLIHLFCNSNRSIIGNLALDCILSGVSPNQPNRQGYRPLHCLLNQMRDGDGLFQQLISYGADPFSTEGTLPTPYDLAIRKGSWNLAFELTHEQAKKGSLSLNHISSFIIHSSLSNFYPSAPQEIVSLLEKFKETQIDNHWMSTLWPLLWQSYEKESNATLKAAALWLMDHHTAKKPLSEGQLLCLQKMLDSSVFFDSADNNNLFNKLEPYLDELLLSNPGLVSTVLTGYSETLRSRLAVFSENSWYNDFIRLSLIAFDKHACVYEKFHYASETETLYQKILERDFPYKEHFCKVMQPVLDQNRRFLADLDQKLTLLESDSLPDSIENVQLSLYIIFKQRWDLLIKKPIIRRKIEITSGMTYHLFLDKLPLPDWRQRVNPGASISSQLIYKAIMEMDNPDHMPAIVQLQHLAQRLIPTYLIFNEDRDYINRAVIKYINAMSIGDELLLPSGTEVHATGLLITKTGSKSYRLTHYNTGEGAGVYHYEGDSRKFQTFDIIEDVPSENLMDPKNWAAFSQLRYKDNIQDLYHIIHNVLGKGGRRLPPSQHSEDYEPLQEEGSCSTQFLMGLLRHQIMHFEIGSQQEKLALYKFLKSQMMLSFYTHNLSDIDAKTQEYAQFSLKKYQATLSLYELAKNQESFTTALNELSLMLNTVLGNTIAFDTEKFDTAYARFAILRFVSNMIAKQMMNSRATLAPEKLEINPHFTLVKAKFEHRQQNLRLWEQRLNTDDSRQLIRELFAAMQSSSRDAILQRITQYIGHERPWETPDQISITASLLFNLNKFKSALWTRIVVQELPEILERDGKGELANWCKLYWQDLSNEQEA